MRVEGLMGGEGREVGDRQFSRSFEMRYGGWFGVWG